MLKHEHSITKDQLQTMIEKYHVCKKELESTQITCEKWVESSKGYEILLNQQIKSNIKFGLGFKEEDLDSTEIIPSNENGQVVKITDPVGNKIVLAKPAVSQNVENIDTHKSKVL